MKPAHILILVIVLLIIFGTAKLPDIARSLGQSAKVMKKELRELQDDEPKQIPPQGQPYQQPYQGQQPGQPYQGQQYQQPGQPYQGQQPYPQAGQAPQPGQPYQGQQGGYAPGEQIPGQALPQQPYPQNPPFRTGLEGQADGQQNQ